MFVLGWREGKSDPEGRTGVSLSLDLSGLFFRGCLGFYGGGL